MLTNKTILVTGGTGPFGNTWGRDEMKLWNMTKKFQGDDRVRFFIEDGLGVSPAGRGRSVAV